MFSCKLSAQTLNMSLRSVASAMESKSVILDQGGVRTRLTFEQLGFDVAVRDEGTGYHQPEGIFLLAGAKAPHSDASRRRIPLTAVAPMLLESFGIVPQSYMTYS